MKLIYLLYLIPWSPQQLDWTPEKKKKKPNCEKKELDMYTPLVQKGILMDIQRCCKECLCLKKKKSLLDMQCFQNILEHNKSWGEIQE